MSRKSNYKSHFPSQISMFGKWYYHKLDLFENLQSVFAFTFECNRPIGNSVVYNFP